MDYSLPQVPLDTATSEGVLDLGAGKRTFTVTRFGGFTEVRPHKGAPWIPIFQAGQVLHFAEPLKKLYYRVTTTVANGVVEFFCALDGSWLQIPGRDPLLGANMPLSATGRVGVVVGGLQNSVDGSAAPLGVFNSAETNRPLATAPLLYNGSTWDMQRANQQFTVITSAARTAGLTSAILTNNNARGILLWLNVTANPGGAQTLQLNVLGYNALLSVSSIIAQAPAQNFGGGAGSLLLMVYPGATVAPPGGTGSAVQSTALPRDFLVGITPSGAGSWTYSVHAQLIN